MFWWPEAENNSRMTVGRDRKRESERGNTEQKHAHVLLTEVLKWLSFCVLPHIMFWNGSVGSCLTEIVALVGCVLFYSGSTIYFLKQLALVKR